MFDPPPSSALLLPMPHYFEPTSFSEKSDSPLGKNKRLYYPFYTIGQRRGLGIHLNRPVFVKEINPEKNEVVLASLSALEKTEMWLKDWNLVNQERTLGHSDIIVKIRYRKQENHATITITPDHLLHVQLHEPLTAIAPGQAAAFYKDGLLLGGGIIVNAR